MNRKFFNLFPFLTSLLILSILFGAPTPALAAGVTIIGNFTQTMNDAIPNNLGGSKKVAESFTMGVTNVNVTQVSLRLQCLEASPCIPPSVTLQGDASGSPSGTALATFSGPSTIALGSVSTYSFTAPSYILTAATKYWLVAQGGGTVTWNGSFNPPITPTGSYATFGATKKDTGSGWVADTSISSFELTGYLTDAERPDTFIDSGPSGTIYTYSTYSATFTYHGSDNITVEPNFTFECFLSPIDSLYQPCNGGSVTYNNLPGNASGITYIFSVRARDEANNFDDSSATQSFTIVTDTTPPTTSLTFVPDTPTSSTSVTFEFVGSDNVTPVDNLTYECRLDEDEATREACISPKAYNNVAEGSHIFDVWAIDEFGNKAADGARYQWTVDLTAPDTNIDSASPATSTTTRSFITFTFSSPDSEAYLECNRDGAGWLTCASPVAYTGFSLGDHTFAVRAIDRVGNTDGTPATYTWTMISPLERSKNGGFEAYTGASHTPKYWDSIKFGQFDGKDIQSKKFGKAAVRFVGGGTAAKTLTQTLLFDGLAGDVFKFTYWVKGSQIPRGSVCKAQVLLYDGSTLVGRKDLRCPTASTFSWKPVKSSLTASKPYTKVVIVFTVKKTGGILWLDGFSLKQ